MTKSEWIVIFVSRLILNLSFRVVYPFLPAISRGLDISFQQAGLFLTVRSATGLAGFFFGIYGERIGYLRWMLVALAILLWGALLVACSQSFSWALLGFAFLGLAQTAYVPAMQAYISTSVPYSQRGRVIGLIELAWSISWFVGIPVGGLLIARFGWHSPFVLISAIGAAVLFFTARLRPPRAAPCPFPQQSDRFADGTGFSLTGVGPILMLFPSFVMSFTCENIMVILGAWLENCFSLQITALGFISALAGLAELAGELTAALVVDRLGKRRVITLGLLATSLAYLALAASRQSLVLVMAGLMVIFFLFEVTCVSMVSYVSELSPRQRGRWLATNYTINVAGRLCASLSGPWLWAFSQSILPNAVMSSVCSLLGLAVFAWSASRSSRPVPLQGHP